MGRTSDAKERLMQAILDLILEQSYGSVTIDAICQRAEVKKGSFYHFFKSKADLTITALEHFWNTVRVDFDRIFSPSQPGLDRITELMQWVSHKTLEVKQQRGRVVGCPYFNIGSEVSGVEPELLAAVQNILNDYIKYFSSAIRDAQSEGQLPAELSAEASARSLFNLYQGTLTQARIHNDTSWIADLPQASLRLLGLSPQPIS